MAELKPGLRLKSAVCDGEAMVVKAIDVTLTCGGAPMLANGEAADGDAQADPEHMYKCLIGKRYVNEEETPGSALREVRRGIFRLRRPDAHGQGNQEAAIFRLTDARCHSSAPETSSSASLSSS